jgi:hypothetical protein
MAQDADEVVSIPRITPMEEGAFLRSRHPLELMTVGKQETVLAYSASDETWGVSLGSLVAFDGDQLTILADKASPMNWEVVLRRGSSTVYRRS